MKPQHILFYLALVFPGMTLVSNAGTGPVVIRGPGLLRLDARNIIEPTEVGTNITGSMQLQFQEKGDVRKQTLLISAAGLETNAQVGLTAAIGSDQNVTTIMNLPSDSRGRVRASFMSKEPDSGRMSRGKEPLPEMLSPLTQVRAICLEDANLAVIGFAWVVNAWNYNYIVRRNLTPADSAGTAEGSIRLVANPRRVSFNLMAGGLTPEADYSLVLNSVSVLTTTADSRGRLGIRTWPTNAPPVLELRSLALVDSGGTTVLSTSLPE